MQPHRSINMILMTSSSHYNNAQPSGQEVAIHISPQGVVTLSSPNVRLLQCLQQMLPSWSTLVFVSLVQPQSLQPILHFTATNPLSSRFQKSLEFRLAYDPFAVSYDSNARARYMEQFLTPVEQRPIPIYHTMKFREMSRKHRPNYIRPRKD
jgi:hypothetical protein